MAELRGLVERCGGESVRTYIASGNVVFAHAQRKREALSARLADAVQDAFAVPGPVVLRTAAELAALVEGPEHTHVVFLERRPRAGAVRDLAALDTGEDRAQVAGADVLVDLPNGVQGAKLGGALIERTLGVQGTMRTWKTVAKLAELAAAVG
jgi:uncharacterized protein (DUF1697 family)